MDGQLVVTTETLISQSEVVAKLVANTESAFRDLKSLITNTNSYWIGNAGNTHREKYTSKESDIDIAIRRLREHVRDLQTMAGVYEEGEREATAEAEALISEVIS